MPHVESGDSLADLLADADFLASIDSQAAAAAPSSHDTAVPAKDHRAGSELRQIFESFSAEELELDWGELGAGVTATGRGAGRQVCACSACWVCALTCVQLRLSVVLECTDCGNVQVAGQVVPLAPLRRCGRVL